MRSGIVAVLLWAASSRFSRARAAVIVVDWNLDAAPPSTSVVDVGDEVVFAWDDDDDDEIAVARNVYFHPSSGGAPCSETNRRPVGRASGASYAFTASDVGDGVFADAPCGSGRAWNVTVSVPPGSNDLCDNDDDDDDRPRARRDWDHMTDAERDLFLEAIETVVDRGLYKAFVDVHADLATSVYAHQTCAFALWHRRFALAMENLLRSADPKFACLALPYWNVMEHHRHQRRNLCSSLGSCSRVVTDVGGRGARTGVVRVHGGLAATGALIEGRPVSRLRDDDGRVGVVRSESILVDPVPESASYERWRATLSIPKYAWFARRLQVTVHNGVHDGVGGTLPTMGSPADPLFWIWHSTIDLFLWAWETCHLDPVATASPKTAAFRPAPLWAFYDDSNECARDDEARDLFPRVRPTDEFYARRGEEDARDLPDVGAYFKDAFTFADVAIVRNLRHNEFTYEGLTPIMWDALLDSSICPSAGNHTGAPTATPPATPPATTPTDERSAYLNDARDALHHGLSKEDFPHLRAYVGYLQCRVARNATALPESDLVERLVNGEVNKTADRACGFYLPDDGRSTTEKKKKNDTDTPSTALSDEGTLAPTTPNVTVTVAKDDDATFSAGDRSSRPSRYGSLVFPLALAAAIFSTMVLLLSTVRRRRPTSSFGGRRAYEAVSTNPSLVVATGPSRTDATVRERCPSVLRNML